MAAAPSPALAAHARRFYYDVVMRELPRCVKAVVSGVRELITQVGSPDQLGKRRDLVLDLPRQAPRWQQAIGLALGTAARGGHDLNGVDTRKPTPSQASELSLVDDDTIELEIVASRLSLGMMDRASWEFSDLRYRISALERREEMDTQDLLRPHVLARAVTDGWRTAGLTLDHWRTAQALLHEEFSNLIQEAYHETNRWLMSQGVCPEVNLRPFIRRSRDVGVPQGKPGSGGVGVGGGAEPAVGGNRAGPGAVGQAGRTGAAAPASSSTAAPVPRYPSPSGVHRDRVGPTPETAHQFAPTVLASMSEGGASHHAPSFAPSGSTGVGAGYHSDVQEETRLMTRSPGLLRSIEQAEAVLGRLNRLVARHVPDFSGSTIAMPHQPSPGLRAAIHEAEEEVRRRVDRANVAMAPVVAGAAAGALPGGAAEVVAAAEAAAAASAPALLQELQQRKQALKQAATTPVERATIEIVALMFQSLLTEERIPATVRVWFARLQMPVLRVAIAEPDFFGSIDHPARKLIDRMGACVMGFEAGNAGVSEPLEKEIKRIVQVVEAYPDTGRRVFQTVLTEFERFLENYFKTAHAAATKGVSLAQQIEQRETLSIQYTIELRKMLNEVPVHDGVREFLFHVWADVLATTAVKSGQSSDATKQMQRAAADLIWLASAKVSREERSEAIRRLPPLLKKLREGMGVAGVPNSKQDEYIQALNNSLQAAFSARTATIPTERLDELMMQLETLEDLLPDIGDIEIDASMIRDLSGDDSQELEVVSEGGSMPTPAMLAWSGDLQVGAWFKLDWRNRIDPVQLAWQGLRKQMSLFVTPQGRGIMFQRHRLASFLQAGLLVPVEEESLTVRATRDALAKLDADPTRILS